MGVTGFTNNITGSFSEPFYSGTGTSSEVPGVYPIGLAGRGYMFDLKSNQYKRRSIPILRGQADVSNLPGEGAINPEDLWRRSQESWHSGAGQTYLDRVSGSTSLSRQFSESSQFRTSKGIDVWTKWQMSLLPDTVQARSSANTNLFLVNAGTRLYLTDGQSTYYTTDVTAGSVTWTAVTGTPAETAWGIASDGFNVYIGYAGANGVLRTDTGSGAAVNYVTSAASGPIGYVKGRLMLANDNVLYNITATGALPAPLLTHDNTAFRWVGFAEGPGQIYAAGFAGDKSLIYRTVIKPTGTALDIPVVAGELPDGEIIRSIQGYLGFIVVGTDLGVRFATIDGQGNLIFGQLIAAGVCKCFEPQDRFVWFGWKNFDGMSTGLGRMDLSLFTAPLTPAFASDLMVTGQGDVLSAATVFHGASALNRRVFTVSGLGVYRQSDNKVASGTLDSGFMTYGIPDLKVGMYADTRTEPLPASTSIEAFISVDAGAFISIGTDDTDDSVGKTFQVGQELGRRFELRLKLVGSTTVSPTVVRSTLRSYAAPNRGHQWVLPLLLYEDLVLPHGLQRPMVPRDELNFIDSLIADRRLVTYQEGEETHTVFVEDYEFTPYNPTRDGTHWNGTCVVSIKEVSI